MVTWRELAIAIPTFRRNGPLLEVLKSIESQSTRPRLIIVIDNSPDAGAQGVVRDYTAEGRMLVEYLPLYQNCGPAGSFASATAALFFRSEPPDWMMCRGDDNPFDTNDAISSMHAFAQRVVDMSPAAIGTHGERYSFREAKLRRVANSELLSNNVVSVDCIPGLGTPTYHLPTLKNAEIGFDPHLFFGFEELDIGLQIKKAGKLLLVDALADYKLRQTLGILDLALDASVYNLKRPNWRIYFGHRNSLLIAGERAHISGIARNIASSLKATAGALVKRRSLAEAAARIAGTIDGLQKKKPPRRKYIPVSSKQVAIDPDSPFIRKFRV